MAGIPGWRARSGQHGLVAVAGALSVGAPILGPPVPVGHASAGGSWPADVTTAGRRGSWTPPRLGAGAVGITDTLIDKPAEQHRASEGGGSASLPLGGG